MRWKVVQGDCVEVMYRIADNTFDSIVCDPPYGLEFMGKTWDKAQRHAFQVWVEIWAQEALRVLRPGGHLLAFGGTRTYHRLTCGIEDAGFEIRDCLMWLYGSGFPKSLDVSKAIDKAAGVEREVIGEKLSPRGVPYSALHGTRSGRTGKGIMGAPCEVSRASEMETAPPTANAAKWKGWGTALKPAYEPTILARKPLSATVAANVVKHGTGALNIDGCRIGTSKSVPASGSASRVVYAGGLAAEREGTSGFDANTGRWPANLILDEDAAEMLDEQSGGKRATSGVSRFFYTPKASRKERTVGGKVDNKHPTVKPRALMTYLVRLVTPPNGVVLDPFTGSGTTGVACMMEGMRFVGIELESGSVRIARVRIELYERAVNNLRAQRAQAA